MELSYVSFSFFVFLIVFLAFYAIVPNRFKWVVVLGFSVFFYASNGLDKLLFILGTSLVVWVCSLRIRKVWDRFDRVCESQPLSSSETKQLRQQYTKQSRLFLSLALILCLGILCYCKFGLRTLRLINQMTGSSLAWRIIVPLGVSYYTFSSIAYLLDVHWRRIKIPEQNYFRLLTCMIYFPHIVEGPISRYDRLLPQLDTLTFPAYDRLCMGLQLMLWGLFKKLVIADRLAIFVNGVFGNIEGNKGFVLVVALVFGAFQVYTDFSGCMDIVTGTSDIIGIQLDKNFNHPFFSRSAAEFWRRWHITLGTWFKDYVYVPVTTSSLTRTLRRNANKRFGASGAKVIMTVLPLATVWLLTGIWHGTGWNYVVWGAYWGLLIICSTLLEDQYKKIEDKIHIHPDDKIWRGFQMLRTFLLYCFGLVLILPGSLEKAGTVLKNLFSTWNPWVFWDMSLYEYGLDQRNFFVAVLSILFLLFVDSLQERMNVREEIAKRNIVLRWAIYFAGIFAVIILGIYGPGYDAAAFIYEQF